MISIITKLVGGSSLAAWLVVAALGASLAGGAYWYVDHRGYARAKTYYKAEIATMKLKAAEAASAEIERQDQANAKAKTIEAQRIADMQAAAESLRTQIEELQREADKDPDASRTVLGPSSVQRINKVR